MAEANFADRQLESTEYASVFRPARYLPRQEPAGQA
jgi:hypothetical protein